MLIEISIFLSGVVVGWLVGNLIDDIIVKIFFK